MKPFIIFIAVFVYLSWLFESKLIAALILLGIGISPFIISYFNKVAILNEPSQEKKYDKEKMNIQHITTNKAIIKYIKNDETRFIIPPSRIKNNFIEINQNSLIDAVKQQNITLIKKHIENGADINEQDENGNNVLMIAVMIDKHTNNQLNIYKQHEIIKYLLENGADAFHKNNYNYNIFEIMKHKNHYAEIQKIVEQYHHKSIQQSKDKFDKDTITVQPNFIEYTESEKLLDKVNLQNKSIIKLENELLSKANLE
jgi:ankyrin repeat protein